MVKNKNKISKDTIAMIDFEVNKKKILDAYTVWFFLGLFGAHRFYLGQGWSSSVMLINATRLLIVLLTWVIIELSWADFVEDSDLMYGIGIPLAVVLFLWWLMDAFLIPSMVKQQNQKLSQDENTDSSDDNVMMNFNANKKNIGISYLLLLFLGGSGAHRFYLKQKNAKIMFAISVFSQMLIFVDIILYVLLISNSSPSLSDYGCMGIIIVLVWRIVDAFNIPRMTREHNQNLADEIKKGSE